MKGIVRCIPISRRKLCRLVEAVLLASVLLAAGCLQTQTRAQMEEEDNDFLQKVTTIGDITDLGNYEPVLVQGVGLVTGLAGTGENPPPSDLRQLLEKELRQKKVRYVKQMLESPDTALVIVQGVIPAGARRGDLIDIVVTLPPNSRVTSLRGGYLEDCNLRIYESKKNINPKFEGNNSLLQGHILARAKGPVLVGLEPGGETGPNVRRGEIWDGGVSFTDRPYFFVLKDNHKASRFSYAVAQRMNTLYQDDVHKQQTIERYKRLMLLGEVTDRMNEQFKKVMASDTEIAKPNKNYFVYVNVPVEYRLNHKRYLLVSRQIPLAESEELRQPYRARLREMLQDPAQTVRAAVRLEALGKESTPVLQAGLKSEHPLVRFASAEALAYLGDPAGVGELARLTEHRDLRAYCLTALASLNEPYSHEKLTELLASSNMQTRYGAFRALQLLQSHDSQFRRNPEVQGELLNTSFWLHRVAADSQPAVHYSLHRRAEVVLFGKDAYLAPPFRIRAGKEFNIIAAADDNRCTVSRFDYQNHRVIPKQCSLKLEEVLRTLADLGADYGTVVDLMREVQDRRCIDCGIALNEMPQPIDIEELALKGRDPKYLRSTSERGRQPALLPRDLDMDVRQVSGRDGQ